MDRIPAPVLCYILEWLCLPKIRMSVPAIYFSPQTRFAFRLQTMSKYFLSIMQQYVFPKIHKRIWITMGQLKARDGRKNMLWPGIETILESSLPQVMISYHNFMEYIGLGGCPRHRCKACYHPTNRYPYVPYPHVHKHFSRIKKLGISAQQWNRTMHEGTDHGNSFAIADVAETALLAYGSFSRWHEQKPKLCRRTRKIVPTLVCVETKDDRLEHAKKEFKKYQLPFEESLSSVQDFLGGETMELEGALQEAWEMEFYRNHTTFTKVLAKWNHHPEYDADPVLSAKGTAMLRYVWTIADVNEIPSTLISWEVPDHLRPPDDWPILEREMEKYRSLC